MERPLLAFAYNTNGFAHHDLAGCFAVLADLGYSGVGLTLDTNHLDPFRSSAAQIQNVAAELRRRNLRVVVETGARYILDPQRKHEPTLLSADGAERRLDFLYRCVDIAQDLGAEAIAVFSGRFEQSLMLSEAWKRLADGVTRVLDRAQAHGGIPVGFEPEPGHFVDKLARHERLVELCGPRLKLTLDLGHVRCTERLTIPEAVRRYAGAIVNAHIEDIKGTQHLHLPFGEGDIEFPPALAALEEVGYRGLLQVELSRNSHDAPDVARRSIDFLRKASRAWQSS